MYGAVKLRLWKDAVSIEDIAGFCFCAKLDDIKEHGYVLTPGRFVGAEDEEDDGVPFEEKFAVLKERLEAQFEEGKTLEKTIISVLTEINTNV